jgi:hypothetical protein
VGVRVCVCVCVCDGGRCGGAVLFTCSVCCLFYGVDGVLFVVCVCVCVCMCREPHDGLICIFTHTRTHTGTAH